ncbi:MAG: protein translocase subunit SecF [Deltaproteobacteria bacterium]|nr:protein translocase subunit SecF [Deltaproteobacteria bacterium]
MEFIGKTNIDFIGKRNISFIISGIISIIGIIGIIQIGLGTANMGIDFTGGTSLQLKFQKPVAMEDARTALSKYRIEAALQEISESNQLLIKVGKTDVALGKISDTVQNVFKKEFPANPFTVESSTEIGPSIGEKLRKDTLIAVAIAMLGIIIYIAWRFDLKFGLAAAVATMHDVLAIFAIFFILGKEVDLLLITAVLTIAGYSLTDTVVVFDRIRENLHKNMKESLEKIFNQSINEVLSRTIITSLTTFLASVSLYLFGGEVIHNFAFALAFGVVIGTYSSVFVASPLVVLWERRAKTVKA